jgi:hypothetical protein
MSRYLRIDVMVVIAVVGIALGVWLMPKSRPHVVIEFGVDPARFEGMPVEIDGKVVGNLKKIGVQTRTGFPVEKGEHVVRIASPDVFCRPATINAQRNIEKVMLILDYSESTAEGQGRPVVEFKY